MIEFNKDDIKALREGVSVPEAIALADGYQIAELAEIISEADAYMATDELYLGIAKKAYPKLKELFSIGTFDEAAKKAYQEQVEGGLKRISEMQEAGVEMQRKLNEALNARNKDLEALTESEANLELALETNKGLIEGLKNKEGQVGTLLNILENVTNNK